MALPGYSNSSIIPLSPGEGSSWEVGIGMTPGTGPMKGAEGIADAQEFLNRIAQQYGYGVEFDPDLYGGLGQPGGPEMQEQEMGTPVTIVQRNEEGQQIGTIPGIRIGYGDNARVVTLDELASINEARGRAGQAKIMTGTPGFVPELVDESGAAITNETESTDSDADANEDTDTDANNSNDSDMTNNDTTSTGIYSGTGERPIYLPNGQVIYVPENLNARELLVDGFISQEIYDLLSEGGGRAPDITGSDSQVTDTTGTGQVTDTTGTTGDGPATGGSTTSDVTTGNLTTGDATTSLQGGDTTVSTGDTSFTGGDLYGGDVSTGDTSVATGDTSVATGATTLTGGAVTTGPVSTDVSSTGQGGAGGSVNINFGDGSSGQGITPEQALDFFTQLSTIPGFQTGAAFESGEVPGIYPAAIQSLPQATSFIRSMLELDRAVSPQQAETSLDLYRQITGGVREAQGPLMQSLARRSDMLGERAEGLMGPLSFLENRAATQAGYGQASALGREIDPLLREQQAGRLREEQKNVNLQLASNLLGQQRATAGLMADIESGIYGRMAPDIGVDPGQILGIAGTDIQNVLGEQAARQYSEAIREGSRKEQQGQLLQTGISLLPKDFISFGGTERQGGFTIPGTGINIGGINI